MKESVVSSIKKIAVMFIASLMVLGLIPVGLLSLRSVSDNDDGKFIRLSPVLETTVSAKTGESDIPGSLYSENCLPAGHYYDSYMRFDIRELLDKDIKNITTAKLRLIPIRTENSSNVPITVSVMENNTWNTDMDYNSKPSSTHDINVTDVNIKSSQCGETPIEIDITEYIKKYISDKRESISLNFKGNSNNSVTFAGASYEDSAYRPCLKILTGDATDPDPSDLRKSVLERVYKNPDGSTHITFNLTPYNIQGAMYKIALALNNPQDAETTPLEVYCDDIPVFSSDNATYEDMQNIDITHTVNTLYSRGATSVNLRVSGVNNIRTAGESTPELNISVSDNRDIAAVTEGLVYALENNSSPAEIKGNLAESYTTESGATANLNWTAFYTDTGNDASDIINSNGSVNCPEWYDNSRNITAVAVASAGNYSSKHQYNLTVQPKELPDYSDNKFSNYLNFGSGKSESTHSVAYSGTEQHSEWISGKHFSYRSITPENILAFSLKTEPNVQNYLTLKLTAENLEDSVLVIENLQNRAAESIKIEPADKFKEGGFVYCTYPIPQNFSTENGYTTFRIMCTNNSSAIQQDNSIADETIPQENTTSTASPTEEPEESTLPLWNIHSAYMTQTPYFDPMSFADQGETLIEKDSLDGTSFYRTLLNLFNSVKPDSDGTQSVQTDDEIVPQTWTKNKDSAIAFTDGENNVSFSLPIGNNPIQIYRSTLYYDSYSEVYPDYYNNGNLMSINYDMYRVLINRSSQQTGIPYQEQNLEGIYYDLVGKKYYAFLGDGMAADVSVLPAGETLLDGKASVIPGETTMILSFLAEPLYFPDWRVSEINGKSVSQVKLTKDISVNQLTIKNVGTATETADELTVLCGVYERGMIVGMEKQTVSIISGYTEYRIPINNIIVKPGQVLKVFIEQSGRPPEKITEKLILP